jgi:hypothetical protein
LLGSAKLNGRNPEAFLREVLARFAHQPITRIDELLPWSLQTLTGEQPTANEATPAIPAQV